MRLHADHRLCAGHARCHAAEPDLFPLDDDGYVAIDVVDVPTVSEDAARRAVAACPERALSLG